MIPRNPLGQFAVGTRTVAEIETRFWSKVRKTDACWIWEGQISTTHYGEFHVSGSNERGNLVRAKAHRFAYELTNGPIPEGLVLDHLCRTTICVNPAHLQAVTNVENAQRRRHCASCTCPIVS